MQRTIITLVLIFFAPLASARSYLTGKWEGSGYIKYREKSHDVQYCERTTIDIEESGPDLIVQNWSTCVMEWRLEPLRFHQGRIFRDNEVIGTFNNQGFQFRYMAEKTGLIYEVHSWREGRNLVAEEHVYVPNLWWSRAYYKYRRP